MIIIIRYFVVSFLSIYVSYSMVCLTETVGYMTVKCEFKE